MADARERLVRLRAGLLQWRPLPGRPDENLATAVELIDRAGAAGCELVAMPELWPCGYATETLARDVRAAAEPLDGPRGRALAERARGHRLWLAAGSVPELERGHRYNAAPLYDPEGRLVARHRKVHRYAAGGEHDAFDAGRALTVCDTALGPVGLTVCLDGDFPENARALRERGVRLVVQAAAYELAAEPWWSRLYPAAALSNGQWWILVNQAGGGCFGRSMVVSPRGDVVAEAARVEADDAVPNLLVVDLPFAAELDRADAEAGVLFDDRPRPATVARV